MATQKMEHEQERHEITIGARVDLPAGLRMVHVHGTLMTPHESALLRGDRVDPHDGLDDLEGVLPQLLKKGWSITYILPIGDGSFYFFLAPPASEAKA